MFHYLVVFGETKKVQTFAIRFTVHHKPSSNMGCLRPYGCSPNIDDMLFYLRWWLWSYWAICLGHRFPQSEYKSIKFHWKTVENTWNKAPVYQLYNSLSLIWPTNWVVFRFQQFTNILSGKYYFQLEMFIMFSFSGYSMR